MIERAQALAALSEQEFDVVVVGGGITGAGVALDAASRGYSVALLERADYASGTSSRSSKLVHGGLRYLQNFDLGLVREALLERQLMVALAPHLVEEPGKARSRGLVLVLEIDPGAGERLRRDAAGPGAQIALVVLRPPQAQIRVFRGADERRGALVVFGDAQGRAALAQRRVDLVVVPGVVAELHGDPPLRRQRGEKVAQAGEILQGLAKRDR